MRQRLVRTIAGYYVVAVGVGFIALIAAGGSLPRWLTAFLLVIPVVAGAGQEVFDHFGKRSTTA